MQDLGNLHSRILESKEQLHAYQNSALDLHRATLVSVTLNLPGAEKEAHFAHSMLDDAVNQVEGILKDAELTVIETRIVKLSIGFAGLVSVDGTAAEVKALCIEVENRYPYTRLFDLDVIDARGMHTTRSVIGRPARTCWACDRPSAECIRSMRHKREELMQVYSGFVRDYLARRPEQAQT